MPTSPLNAPASIVIIGASHSGIACAEKLRKLGYAGAITLIDRLGGYPLERPPLSKKFLVASGQDESGQDDAAFMLRGADWFDEAGMTLIGGHEAVGVDADAQTVTLDDGRVIHWDRLVLATGAYPRRPLLSGDAADDVLVLRNPHDARQLRERLQKAHRVTIIGGGYIGLEVAASVRNMGKEVDLIEAAPRLLARVASEAASCFFHQLHHQHGVTIHAGAQIQSIQRAGKGFELALASDAPDTSGAIIADQVIAGIGVVPDMALAETLGLACGNGILTDNAYRTERDGIFAIGDVALPGQGYGGGSIRLESVHHAQMSAEIAATAMLGETPPDHETPWFWSEQYDVRLQSAGLVPAEHETVTRPGRRDGSVSFWSFAEGRLKAVEAINDGQAYMVGRSLLPDAEGITPALLADPLTDLKALMRR